MGQPPRSGDTLIISPVMFRAARSAPAGERAHHGDVTVVECGDLVHAAALGRRDHGGVRRPETQVGTRFHQLRRPPVVTGTKIYGWKSPSANACRNNDSTRAPAFRASATTVPGISRG